MSSKSEIGIKLSLAGAQQVEAGLRKVGGSVGGMEGALNAARQSLLSLVPAIGAAFSAASMAQMLKGVSDSATEIERLARLADSTPQEFQRFAAGAKTVGVDMEKFASITKDVQDKIGDFLQTGGGELKDFFEKIAPKVGVTAEQFKNLSGPQALQLFYNSLQKANLGQKETVFWMESIADDATLLIKLLANNGAEFERMGNKAEAAGIVMSKYLLAASSDLTEQTKELDTQLTAAGYTIAEQLFPALTETARAFADLSRDSALAEMAGVSIRTVFETVVITGANVSKVIRQAGADLVGLYDQAAALAKFDFKGAMAIGNQVDLDAERRREELYKFEQRILNAGKNAKEYFDLTDGLKKAKFGSDEFIKSVEQLAGMQNRGAISADQLAAAFRGLEPASKSGVRGVSGMGVGAEAAKKAAEEAKKAADELKKSYQSALDGAASQARDLTAEAENLNAAEKKLADIMASPAWAKWNATQRETVRTLFERNSATIKAQELAKADEKWAQESRESNLAFAEAALEAAASAEEQAHQQRLANEALGLSSLALANLEAARLDDAAAEKTRLAAIMEGIDPGIADSYRRQAAALTDLAQAKREGAVKQAGVDAAQEAKEAWDKTASEIEQSLTDALMRGFESGKGFGQNLVDTIKNMFNTLVLRPVIQTIINPVAGTLTAAMGLPGAASAGQAGQGVNPMSLASSANSAYTLLTTGIRDSIANGFTKLASSNLGQQLGLYDADAGVRGLTGTGQSISSGLQSAGGSPMAYGLSKGLSGGYQVGNGKIMDAATLVAGWFDPTGGLIAGAVSGAINRAFGRKLADSGLQGTFGGDQGFSGSNYEFYKGGWFRSDKTKTRALDPEIETALADQFRALQASTGLMATTLGLGTDAIAGFTSSIKLSFKGLNEEQIQTQLAEEFAKVGESLAATALGTERYTRTGETAAQTLQRLSSSLSTVNGSLDVLGRTLYAASLSSADMASELVDLMGGLTQYQTTTAAYYEAYYTEAERNATATRQLTASLAALGMSLPATREGFRDLVEAQDLSTSSGRTTYAALMGLSAAFASITPSADDLAGQLQVAQDAITGLLASLVQSVSESRAAVAAARDVVNGPTQPRNFVQLTTAVDGVKLADLPSTAAMDQAAASLKSAGDTSASASAALAAANRRVDGFAQLDSMEKAYESMYNKAKDAFNAVAGQWSGSYFNLATPTSVENSNYAGGFMMPSVTEYSNVVWDAFNYSNVTLRNLRDSLGSRSDATSAQAEAKKTDAAAQAASTSAASKLATEQSKYITAVGAWIKASELSVKSLSALREETVAYYESQRELAAVMQTSASGVRESIKQAKLQTLTTDQSMAARQAEFARNYSLALSTTGSTKAGYADQLAGALPQLSQDLASTAASRADWAVAVAKLSTQADTVAAQLEATAPKNYQAEANTLLTAIDAKLASVDASATSAEAVISKAVNDGSTRTAAGLQQIINQLQGKTVSAFAKGGVFTNSVVDTPTMAPMALFGEAGAEAIMPLSRGPGGVLGVRAFGSAGGDRADPGDTERLLRDLVAEVQRLNARLEESKRSGEQMRQENNIGNSKIADAADRLARLVERWDVVGLPATAKA